MRKILLAAALVAAVSGCAGGIHLGSSSIDVAAIGVEKSYTAAIASATALARAGQVSPAKVKANDAKSYAALFAARVAHDVLVAPSAALLNARAIADTAHTDALSL